ncbi:MAG: hypothetical protein KDB86_09265 [Actinobacteria bacterium]|nr:hypothetical protein [Actinomycetota bacterium]
MGGTEFIDHQGALGRSGLVSDINSVMIAWIACIDQRRTVADMNAKTTNDNLAHSEQEVENRNIATWSTVGGKVHMMAGLIEAPVSVASSKCELVVTDEEPSDHKAVDL